MNSHTHTPGPWSVENPSKGCPSYIIHTETDELAFVLSSEHNNNGIANARLIAAAPEMLNHLKMLVFGICEGVDIPQNGAAVAAALEVIAKVERGVA